MKNRPYNFSAGPAVIPDAVLDQIKAELFDFHAGMSVLEMSHRSKPFVAMIEQCEQDLRSLMQIPDEYAVIFMQGGATGQFSAVPLNLLGKNPVADYVETGIWSEKAVKEAASYGDVKNIACSADTGYTSIPEFSTWQRRPHASYLHYTPNETINGVEFHWTPKVDVPLVADMSSCILSRKINVSDFALIYAGAQKNMGPAGITIVIVHKDLIGHANPLTPSVFNYANFADCQSLYNTPPTFAWYVCSLMFKWLKEQGGVEAMEDLNARKAALLYDFIDQSDFYHNPVNLDCRSRLNIPFLLADTSLEKLFIQESEAAGLQQLAGHRSVGGMRASMYNAMPLAGAQALVNFMKDFEKRHG
jgi:phosphoserine aminotransferase